MMEKISGFSSHGGLDRARSRIRPGFVDALKELSIVSHALHSISAPNESAP
jgi:hypothetical protein